MGRQYQGMTGLEFAKFQRAVENREKWRKLVAKLSVVPQQPSRLLKKDTLVSSLDFLNADLPQKSRRAHLHVVGMLLFMFLT